MMLLPLLDSSDVVLGVVLLGVVLLGVVLLGVVLLVEEGVPTAETEEDNIVIPSRFPDAKALLRSLLAVVTSLFEPPLIVILT